MKLTKGDKQMEYNKPQFCTYCGKNISKYLDLMEGMVKCPYCGGKLFHMEEEYKGVLDKETKPVIKKKKVYNYPVLKDGETVKEHVIRRTLSILAGVFPSYVSRSRLLGHFNGIKSTTIHPIWDEMVKNNQIVARKVNKVPHLRAYNPNYYSIHQ